MPDRYQAMFDAAFDHFTAGDVDRRGYAALFDAMPREAFAGMERRIDRRTPGGFALDVFDHTATEKALVAEWLALFRGWDFSVTDLGVANDGRVVRRPGPAVGRPDYRFHHPGGTLALEVKPDRTDAYATYKKLDLRNYEGRPDCRVLTILRYRRPTGWFVFGPDDIPDILLAGEHGNEEKFGGKGTVRIHARQFPDLFQVHPWEPITRRRRAA